jgi:predicted DNA-binding ribbon-helix-helix protein
MGLHRLVDELRDEIADAVNYLTFLDVQLGRWKSSLEDRL